MADAAYRPVAEADEWLLHVRLGRDRAEGTTEAYARSLALFLDWCAAIGAYQFGRFVYWVQHYDPDAPARAQLRVVRGPRRVNAVLAAVREFFKHAVAVKLADKSVLDALFDLVEDYDLPAEARGDRPGPRLRSRPRHKLSEPARVVDAASDEEVLAMLKACRNARDRFIVLALWRIGNRRGELTGIRLEDAHFVPDATRLGCRVRGEHLHVHRRANPNGADAAEGAQRAAGRPVAAGGPGPGGSPASAAAPGRPRPSESAGRTRRGTRGGPRGQPVADEPAQSLRRLSRPAPSAQLCVAGIPIWSQLDDFTARHRWLATAAHRAAGFTAAATDRRSRLKPTVRDSVRDGRQSSHGSAARCEESPGRSKYPPDLGGHRLDAHQDAARPELGDRCGNGQPPVTACEFRQRGWAVSQAGKACWRRPSTYGAGE